MVSRPLFVALTVFNMLASCQPPAFTFPGKTWQRLTPEQAGMDPAKIKIAMNYAKGEAAGVAQSYCASVHRNGYLVADSYWQGTHFGSDNIIWSVSKCVTAALIGIAEYHGKMKTTDLMTKYVPEWKIYKDADNMTVDDIMRHCSGRYWDPIEDYVTPQFFPDQTAYAIGLPQAHPPRTKDQYNCMAYQTLEEVLRKAAGDVKTFSKEALFNILQVESDVHWREFSLDVNLPTTRPLVYGGLMMSCADLGRFAHLWLAKGKWNNQVVFPESFFWKAMAQPKAAFGPERMYGNWGPHDSNWSRAEGVGNQFIGINPALGLVATRLGWEDSISEVFTYNIFMADILASVLKYVNGAVTTEKEIEEHLKGWIVMAGPIKSH